MFKNDVIKNAIWEIDRACKRALGKDLNGEVLQLVDLLEGLGEMREMCAEYEKKILAHADNIIDNDKVKNFWPIHD